MSVGRRKVRRPCDRCVLDEDAVAHAVGRRLGLRQAELRPRRIAGLEYFETSEFSHKGEGLDTGIKYRSADQKVVATLYVYYPSLAAWDASRYWKPLPKGEAQPNRNVWGGLFACRGLNGVRERRWGRKRCYQEKGRHPRQPPAS